MNHSYLSMASNPPRALLQHLNKQSVRAAHIPFRTHVCPFSCPFISYPTLCSRFLRLSGLGFIFPIYVLCSFISFVKNAILQLSKWLTHSHIQLLIQCHHCRDHLWVPRQKGPPWLCLLTLLISSLAPPHSSFSCLLIHLLSDSSINSQRNESWFAAAAPVTESKFLIVFSLSYVNSTGSRAES